MILIFEKQIKCKNQNTKDMKDLKTGFFSELYLSNNIIHRNQVEEELFNKYVAKHTTDKGIELKRVLYGIIAKK